MCVCVCVHESMWVPDVRVRVCACGHEYKAVTRFRHSYVYMYVSVSDDIMKSTKVLTLGAGRESCPTTWRLQTCRCGHTRPLPIRMRYMCIYACAVLLIGGRAGPFY